MPRASMSSRALRLGCRIPPMMNRVVRPGTSAILDKSCLRVSYTRHIFPQGFRRTSIMSRALPADGQAARKFSTTFKNSMMSGGVVISNIPMLRTATSAESGESMKYPEIQSLKCLTTGIGYLGRVGDGGFDEPGEFALPVAEGDTVLGMLDAEDGEELGAMGGKGRIIINRVFENLLVA